MPNGTPDETLESLREWAAARTSGQASLISDDDAAELFFELDGWIFRGGDLPEDWKPLRGVEYDKRTGRRNAAGDLIIERKTS